MNIFLKMVMLVLSILMLSAIIFISESKLIFSYIIVIGSGFLFSLYLRELFYTLINFLSLLLIPFVFSASINESFWMYLIGMFFGFMAYFYLFKLIDEIKEIRIKTG